MPKMNTPMDVIDHLCHEAYDLVCKQNAGRDLTPSQFAAAHARSFEAAFTEFMAALDKRMGREGADEFRRAYIAQYEAIQKGGNNP